MDKNKIVGELIAERDRLNRAIAALTGEDVSQPAVKQEQPRPTKRQRKHHELSEEAKAKVSERMKKYWAQRKQAGNGQ